MPYIDYDDNRIITAVNILKEKIKGFECILVSNEVNGEVHYWLDSRWNFADTTQPPYARLIKKENEKVYLIVNKEEICIG